MNDPNSESKTPDREHDWEPCAAGTITGLVRQLKQRRRVQQIKKTSIAASCVLVAVVIGNQFIGGSPSPLSHNEVVQLSDQFINGTLDPETTKLVEAHISRCPLCEHLLEDRKLRQQQAILVMPDDSVVVLDSSPLSLIASTH